MSSTDEAVSARLGPVEQIPVGEGRAFRVPAAQPPVPAGLRGLRLRRGVADVTAYTATEEDGELVVSLVAPGG